MTRAAAMAVFAGAAAATALVPAVPLHGQYSITSPSGESLEFDRDRLLRFRERSDSLRTDLEEDPDVLYFTTFGRELGEEDARDALPWNAIEVVADSLAALIMPGNLREADRAYVNYAVLRMHAERQDPDVPCAELIEREVRALDGFVDGWILARTLYGGPAFWPLDELAFAREAGLLPALAVARSDRQVRSCLEVWREAHADRIDAYRAWRREQAQELR
ncbi:MAG: hypothetical protein R3266_09915 [Gemmatimonadota bacterium]|nr:hypothetical protein [Gemmatimonadota bacterium]